MNEAAIVIGVASAVVFLGILSAAILDYKNN